MGSRKNEATGISLLSMYNDEDDEMEDAESESEDEVVANEEGRLDKADLVMGDEEEGELRNERNVEGATESNHDPQQHVMKDEQLNDKNGSLNFVDYGHDEVAMSPEAVKVLIFLIFCVTLMAVLFQFHLNFLVFLFRRKVTYPVQDKIIRISSFLMNTVGILSV